MVCALGPCNRNPRRGRPDRKGELEFAVGGLSKTDVNFLPVPDGSGRSAFDPMWTFREKSTRARGSAVIYSSSWALRPMLPPSSWSLWVK